jgi:hypothetical protein
MPYDELPIRVNRIAYREFTRDPDLPFETFRQRLARDVFGNEGHVKQSVDDLLALQRVFAQERTWCQPSPLVSPQRVRAMKASGQLSPARRVEYRAALDRVGEIERRHANAQSDDERELHRIAVWVLERWKGEAADLLRPESTGPAH